MPNDASLAPLCAAEQTALVDLLYRQSHAMLFINFVIPIPAVAVFWSHLPHALLLAWGASIMLATLARIALARGWSRHTQNPAMAARGDASRVWAWRFAVACGLSSALWGAMGWAFYLSDQPQLLAFLAFVIAGMSCGSITSFAAFPPAAVAAQTLLILPFAVRNLGQGHGLPLVYGVFALCLYGANLFYTRVSYRTLVDSVRLRFENAALVDQLKKERDRAETANRAKSKFLAAASHDLRQPLHALGLFLDSLQRSALSERQAEVLGHARAASVAASEMLTTLLDYSRVEAGVVRTQEAPFAIQPLLSALEREFGAQADATGLVYRSRETTAAALADKALVDLVMRNLLSNALRYTQTGGVLVACRRRAQQLALEVWDTGCGIAPEHLQSIFEEFHQLGNPERDRRKGLGLGLAIAQRLALQLHTRIDVRSLPGRGSVFRLCLPLWSGALQSVPDPLAAPAASEDRLAGLHIVVIDDDEAARRAMQSLLESWHCHCTCAESGPDALQQLSATKQLPDAIITDFRLRNGETGKEALQLLREHGQHPVPAIIVTGDTSPQRLRDAQSTAALLLHKPVSTADLQQALIRLLHP